MMDATKELVSRDTDTNWSRSRCCSLFLSESSRSLPLCGRCCIVVCKLSIFYFRNLTFFFCARRTEIMRPTTPCLVRLIRRADLPTQPTVKTHVLPVLTPYQKEKRKTLYDVLVEKKEAAGSSWPPNLRVEPVVPKSDLQRFLAI